MPVNSKGRVQLEVPTPIKHSHMRASAMHMLTTGGSRLA